MTEYDLSSLSDALPRDAAEILAEMGIGQADFSGLFQVSFSDVAQTVVSIFKGSLREPLTFLFAGFGVLVLLGLFSSFGEPNGKSAQVRAFVSSLFLVTCCALPLHGIVAGAVASLHACGVFMASLIPVLAAVIASAGNPVLSVVWQTAVFSAAQTISATAYGFMAPCCGMLLGVGVFDSLVPQSGFSKLSGEIRKTAVWIFSAMATLFTAFLSLKGILAGAADSLAAKGIKLAVSSFIPVIGSQLSEAYAAVAGSLAAVRATAAVFAVAGICAVMLPTLAQLLLWLAALKGLSLTSELLGQKNAVTLFAAFSSALSVLFACLLFVTVLFVLCLGIIMTIKAGV